MTQYLRDAFRELMPGQEHIWRDIYEEIDYILAQRSCLLSIGVDPVDSTKDYESCRRIVQEAITRYDFEQGRKVR